MTNRGRRPRAGKVDGTVKRALKRGYVTIFGHDRYPIGSKVKCVSFLTHGRINDGAVSKCNSLRSDALTVDGR